MKKTILFTILTIFLSLQANAKEVIIDVNGLVCEFCAYTIEKNFNKKDEVKSVKVDLESKKVKIDFKNNKNLTNEEISSIIQNNGYNVIKINRK